MRRFIIVLFAGFAVSAQIPASYAGIYQPEVLLGCDIDEHGFADVPPLNTFLTILSISKKTDNPENDETKAIRRRIAETERRTNLTPEETINLAADLLRLRKDESSVAKAFGLLNPIAQRPPKGMEFIVQALLAHAYSLRQDFQQAMTLQYAAVKDSDFPEKLAGLTPEQLRWYRRLEVDYHLLYFKRRMEDALQKGKSVVEPFPLFPAPVKGKAEPVRFVAPSGKFEAGTIAESEKAKLPPDCIAIVQQLILWHPEDGSLWWLLAELYNAAGDLKSAAHVYRLCSDPDIMVTDRQLRTHRNDVFAALDALAEKDAKEKESRRKAEEEQKRLSAQQQREKYLWAGAGVAAVLMFVGYWQAKEIFRRMQKRRVKNVKQIGPVD